MIDHSITDFDEALLILYTTHGIASIIRDGDPEGALLLQILEQTLIGSDIGY